MRCRLSGGRVEVVTADGRHVRYPPTVLVVLLLPLAAAGAAFLTFADSDDGASLGRDLRVAATNLVVVEPVRQDSAIPTIELVVPNNTFSEMERALRAGDTALRHELGGDRPFFNALYLDGNMPVGCEIALLAPPGHHDEQKPSLRIKFKKQDARGGERRIDLYRPEDALALEAMRYAQLAQRLDLLHDGSTPVRLLVNSKPFGVYQRALPPGPAITYAARRLPGTFAFSAPGSDAWTDPGAWHGFGTDSVEPLPLAELLAVISAKPSAATTEELWRLVDFESLARWAAVRAVLGRTSYEGAQHCLFFAAGHGRIEAVAWLFDGTTAASNTPVEAEEHGLLDRVEQESDWTRRRDHWIAELLVGDLPGADLVHAPDLAADLHLVERRDGMLVPVSIAELERFRARDATWIEERAAFLRACLHGASPSSVGAEEVPPALVLGPGAVELAQDVVTAPGQPLVIRAGTRIALRAGVGIYARGPTAVEGTAEAPVVLRSAAWEPWAAFALLGPRTAGSRIAWLDTQDGGAGRLHHQRLGAGFVVHNTHDVEIADSRFGPNAVDGDSVCITRAQVTFTNCLFEDARGDALDSMFSTGRLDGCRFIVADRNGFDLFASRFEIARSHFDCALRAAVSVGEGSRAMLVDTVLQRSDLGLDAHDDGRALLRRVRFQANRIGLFCEHRDWRHDRGGAAALDGAGFFSSREGDVSAGSRSVVWIHESGEPKIALGAHRVQRVDALPPGWLDDDTLE
jgi:hypothetical protein